MATDRPTEDGIDRNTDERTGGSKSNTVVLDAREVDGGPFDEIVTTLESLDTDQELVLINSFEPEPLYDVIERKGFSFETNRVGDNEYHVTIRDV